MSGNTILVIEDEADIRELLAFSLERAGFTVQEARDSEEALRRLEGVGRDRRVLRVRQDQRYLL